jgi:hypothetical protein
VTNEPTRDISPEYVLSGKRSNWMGCIVADDFFKDFFCNADISIEIWEFQTKYKNQCVAKDMFA